MDKNSIKSLDTCFFNLLYLSALCKRHYLCTMTIEELEAYFSGIDLPQSLELSPGTRVNDVAHCIQTHLVVLKIHGNVRPFEGFYDRLIKIKEIIESA